jgi:hypothetical protein
MIVPEFDPHILLLLLIATENADFPQVHPEKPPQYGIAE